MRSKQNAIPLKTRYVPAASWVLQPPAQCPPPTRRQENNMRAIRKVVYQIENTAVGFFCVTGRLSEFTIHLCKKWKISILTLKLIYIQSNQSNGV